MNFSIQRLKAIVASAVLAVVFSGCGNSDNFVFTNTTGTVPPVNQAPVAVDDAFPALGNATLQQAAANGVLVNDTVNGATITAFDATGSQGGTLALAADGSFTYTPATGFVGAETFTYTLTNADGSSTATITLTSTGRGFFVNNQAAPGGDGSQPSPFDTLAAGIAAAASGDTVFVATGDGTSAGLAGAVNLPQGVNLVGEGTGLILAQTIVPAGQPPELTGPINCGGDNTISGLNIIGSAAVGININAVGNVTVSSNTIGSPTMEHILVNEATGTVTINDNTFQDPPNANLDFINVINNGANASFSLTGNAFSNTAVNNVDSLAEFYSTGATLDITYSQNIANGTMAGEFDYGFYTFADGTSNINVTVTDNQFTNFDDEVIGTHASFDATATGTITGNTCMTTGDYGFHATTNNGTTTISGNVINGTADDGIHLDGEFLGGTFIVDNNNVSNSSESGIVFDYANSAPNMSVAIRNNTVMNCSTFGMEFFWGEPGTLCMDIVGNTVSDGVDFIESGGTFNVEQFATLGTINSITGGITTFGTITDVADGACAIP